MQCIENTAIVCSRFVPTSLWPEDTYPAFCNGYIYAIRPQVAFSLTLASRTTPLLPLDDVYVTGVLRDRLDQPKVGIKLINSFSIGTAFFEWIMHCPFLGVGYPFLLQDIAFERGNWDNLVIPKLLGCLFLEEYLGIYTCDGKG